MCDGGVVNLSNRIADTAIIHYSLFTIHLYKRYVINAVPYKQIRRVRRPRRTALLNPSETPQCSEGTIHAHSAIHGENQFMSQDNSFRIADELSSPLQVFPPQRHNLCRVDGLPRPQARSASYPMHRRYHIVCKANISRTKCISHLYIACHTHIASFRDISIDIFHNFSCPTCVHIV